VERFLRRAEALGATEARLVAAREIVVDERVRLKCQVPLCPHYGRALLCPPHLPPVGWFRRVLGRYRQALILQVRCPAHGPAVHEGALRLHHIVNEVERAAYDMGLRLAAGFIGGACRLCAECVGVHSREPCRHPYKARPSMEGMGIDVAATLANVGLTIRFPPEEEVRWTGLVLIE
jgi:predicted metal-binding protein